MERRVPSLGLATAMAVSGAAASANMGRHTLKLLTFSLSLLNIRLGYWLPNPAQLERFGNWFVRRLAKIGTYFFAMESFGRLDTKRLNVYLTDGGHIENLGIYELLRRRCKVIVASDAEADLAMVFPSFVELQVMARIDFGILIDLPWQQLQKSGLAVTDTSLYGPDGPPGRQGPHIAVGTIHYSSTEKGVLIYIKSCLSGDENDYVLDYKRRNASFPHESTLDQFYSEEQFEAYRALGFHATFGFFTGADDFAKSFNRGQGSDVQLREALMLLNLPQRSISAILARALVTA